MSTSFRLLLPRQFYTEMIAQARAELPNECCGLLGGRVENGVGTVVQRYPLANLAASPKRYWNDSTELFAADRAMRKSGLHLLAIYHSHPDAAPEPSATDLAQNYYGDVTVFFIISLQAAEPEVRAWWLSETDYRPAEWELLE